MKIIIWFLFLSITMKTSLNGQTSSFYGTILDEEFESPLIGCQVFLLKNGFKIKEVLSDFSGEFKFDKLFYGIYEVKVNYLGYNEKSLYFLLNKRRYASQFSLSENLALYCGPITYRVRDMELFSFDNTSSGQTFYSSQGFLRIRI